MADQQQQQDRTPRSLNDLLKWTVKLHESEIDRTGPSQYSAMDPEKRKFLEDVLKSISVSELELIKNSLEKLQKEGEKDEQEVLEKEEALEALHALIDNLDNARDLQIIGGYHLVIRYLSNQHSSLKWRAAEIVGTVVQNDPPAQKVALETGTLPLLLEAFGDPEGLVRKKVVYAVSALVRHNPLGTKMFFESRGMEFLRSGLNDTFADVQTKTAFFLFNLLNENEYLKEVLPQANFLPILISKLESEDPFLREHILSVLLFLSSTPENAKIFRQPEFSLKQKLEKLLERAAGLSQEQRLAAEEEIAHAKELLKICF